MMLIAPFELTDMRDLAIERLPLASHEYYEPRYMSALASYGPAWTARIDGTIMLIAGVSFDIERIGWLWSFLPLDSGPHMISLTRAVQRTIDTLPRPLRSTVDKLFEPSCRWLRLFGFRLSNDPCWPPGPDTLFELI